MVDRLFIYGTLAPGRPNEHVLADVPGEWTPATIRGELVQQGWGAAAGFPGIIVDEHGPEVHGFLFTSEQLGEHWERLDDFEGEGYQRIVATVRLRDGTAVDAHVYALRQPAA